MGSMARNEIEILTTKPKDEGKWKALLEPVKQCDIFFTFDYIKILSEHFQCEGNLFVYRSNGNYILLPFLKKRINELPFFKEKYHDSKEEFFDITSTDYGGPISFISNKKDQRLLYKNCFKAFHAYCVDNNIVSEFTRLHPLIKNHLCIADIVNVTRIKNVICVDLSQTEEQIFNNFKKNTRECIRKSKRRGVKVRIYENEKDVHEFLNLYKSTMDRNMARDDYYYSKDFINKLLQLPEGTILFVATVEDKVVSACLSVYSSLVITPLLNGFNVEYLKYSPNDLLYYKIMLWAKDKGIKWYNFGGGIKENDIEDSLYKFKVTFSNTPVDFYRYTVIHNQDLYNKFCELWDDTYSNKTPQINQFFPYYRKIIGVNQ